MVAENYEPIMFGSEQPCAFGIGSEYDLYTAHLSGPSLLKNATMRDLKSRILCFATSFR